MPSNLFLIMKGASLWEKLLPSAPSRAGVGKTMLCFNIGGILSQLERRVLVVDSDLQGNLTNNMGIDRINPDLFTTYDIYNIETPSPLPAADLTKTHRPAA